MIIKRHRSELVNKMISYKNVLKFKHQGRNQQADCGGAVLLVLRDLNMYDGNDMINYKRSPDGKQLRNFIVDNTEEEKPVTRAEPGDIFLMRWPSRNEPSHVGFIGFNNTILHCFGPAGTVIEEDLTQDVKDRIIAVYTPKNLK